MSAAKSSAHRLRVVRVVTASYVVPWHLANTLRRMPEDFETWVVGKDVSENSKDYPHVHWIDLDLERKVSPWTDLKALLALYKVFQDIQPDIVHSIMPKAGLLAAIAGFLCRVPVRLHTFTGQVWATKQGVIRRIYQGIDRLIVMLNTVCMTDSHSQSKFLEKQGIKVCGNALPVLGNGSLSGVDISRFHPDTTTRKNIRAELGIPLDRIVFLYLGRLHRDKGILDLVDAFALLPDKQAHLILAGPDEGNILPEVYARIGECRERLHVTGFVAQPEQMFMAADVFCLPSYREGFGSVVIEAAACGLPAIGTRISGLIDAIVDGETGLLFPAGDVQELLACIKTFLGNPRQCRIMGEKAKKRAEQLFDANVVYQALRTYYVRLTNNAGIEDVLGRRPRH